MHICYCPLVCDERGRNPLRTIDVNAEVVQMNQKVNGFRIIPLFKYYKWVTG